MVGQAQDNSYRQSLPKEREMEARKELLAPTNFEIKQGKLNQFSRPENNSLPLVALLSGPRVSLLWPKAPLAKLTVLTPAPSFRFHEGQHMFAVEKFSQPVSCFQNVKSLTVFSYFSMSNIILFGLFVCLHNCLLSCLCDFQNCWNG